MKSQELALVTLSDVLTGIPAFLKHINWAARVSDHPSQPQHLPFFLLLPLHLPPLLLPSLFTASCSASSRWQPFLSISFPLSLFPNPALATAPLLCSLSLLLQAVRPDTSHFPFYLHCRSSEDRDTSHFILHANPIFHPTCCKGQRCGVN